MSNDPVDLQNFHLADRPQNWLKEFNEKTQQEFLRKLINPKNKFNQYVEATNELAIGHLLQKAGFSIEYEKVLDGKTPDWFISGTSNHTDFIIEVVTLNISDRVREFYDAIELLKNDIRALQYPVRIEMGLNHIIDDSYEPNMQSRQMALFDRESIKSQVIQWLQSNPELPENNVVSIDNFTFRYIGSEKSKFLTLEYDASLGYRPQISRLISAVKEKGSKYSELLRKHNLPYVVAIHNTFDSRLNPKHIEAVFLGRKIINFPSNHNFKIIPPVIHFHEYPDVTGFLIIEYVSDRWGIVYYDNPHASIKLPQNIFSKLETLHDVPDDKIDLSLAGEWRRLTFADL